MQNILKKILIRINNLRCFSFIKIDIDSQVQFVLFCVVGVSNTVLSYVIYTVSLFTLRYFSIFEGFDYYIAQITMFVLSVAWSFYWNNRFVFRKEVNQERSLLGSLIKTYISYSITGLFLNSLLLYIWVEVIEISEFIAPILNLFISIPINFLLNKFWAFKTTNC